MKEVLGFIGIGAVKSGSSWMASLLSQHPVVCMSTRKEVAFFNTFNFNGTRNESSSYGEMYYSKFWPTTNKIKGEVSPQYLFDFDSAHRIKRAFPDVHILAMLRNPKKVVYSHFLYERFFNRSIDLSLSFLEALEQHPYLLQSACFTKQLKQYFKEFDPDKIHVFFLDEALENQEEFSKQLYRCINLNDVHFKPDYASVNESKQIDSRLLNVLIRVPSMMKKILERTFLRPILAKAKQSRTFLYLVKWRNNLLDKNIKRLDKPEMTSDEKNYLRLYFKNEIEELEELLQVDLTRWKTSD